jgi:hypothetical protein
MQYPWLRRLFGSLVALSFTFPLTVQAQGGTQTDKKTNGLKPVTQERLLKGNPQLAGLDMRPLWHDLALPYQGLDTDPGI